MRRVAVALGLFIVGLLAVRAFLVSSDAAWAGVDETVIETMAREAGREPRAPYGSMFRGDVPLLFALLAGALGGFAAGYYFRSLFASRAKTAPPAVKARSGPPSDAEAGR